MARLSMVTILLAAVLAPAAHAKPSYCKKTAVQEIRIASGKPKLAGLNTVICRDVTDDGVKDAIYTVLSGGTAGPVRFGVVRGGGKVRIIREWQGYKVTVDRVNHHRFDVQQPFYAKDDPNCCPSAFDVTPYRWRDGRFRAGKAKRFKDFQPGFA